MKSPELQSDVFDPTADPRHGPVTATPGPDPTVPRPRDLVPDAVPPPDEPIVAQAGGGASPAPAKE